jgi:hypothetical protein
MDAQLEKPFDSRVFRIPTVMWPMSIEVCGYCTAGEMTPGIVEALVAETEQAIGEPITHTCRKTFPAPRKLSIQEEVALAWKAPKRGLQLSTKLSRPNYVEISASRYPRPKGGAYPADWGQFRILVRSGAPEAMKVITRLQKYGQVSNAFFARADSPEWWDSYKRLKGTGSTVALPCFRIAAEPGWAIGERLGWINYFGPRAAREIALDEAARTAGVHKAEVTSNGGRLLWITEEPLNFCNETHRLRYCGLLSALSAHAIA